MPRSIAVGFLRLQQAVGTAIIHVVRRTRPRFAIALAGGPLIALLDNLWFVPAFLYVIAVLHLWLACLHETRGRLQYRSASRHAKEELQ